MTPPWYETAFGPDYSDIYGHRDRKDARRAVAFLLRVAGRHLDPGRVVLDLCCGEGRHSLELLEHLDAQIVGMDLSPHLLRNIARQHGTPARLDLVRGDMRRIPFLDGRFDLVLNLFTSFGYFSEDEENERALGEVARALAPARGCFVLDHIHPRYLKDNLRPETTRTTARGTKLRETRRIVADQRRVEKRIEFERDGKDHVLIESVRLYEPEEMRALAGRHGLTLEAIYGDFEGSTLNANSPRAIYVFRNS